MSDIINTQNFHFSIRQDADLEKIKNVAKALSSIDKLNILRLISKNPMTLSELAKELNLAVSTVSFHVDALVEAQLVCISYRPTAKGHTKLCTKVAHNLFIDFDVVTNEPTENEKYEKTVEMPIGNFVECDIQAPCGMAGKTQQLIENDCPDVFFSQNRTEAELLWFQTGHVSYLFPTDCFRKGRSLKQISFSMELCSEAVYFRNDWPSDITIWINDIEIATYVSPGDYGGKRGRYTPQYWYVNSTQYGLLKTFTVTESGVYIDKTLVNKNLTFSQLKLAESNQIKLTIGIKDDALHKGGINLFGKNFGNYPQAIVMTISE